MISPPFILTAFMHRVIFHFGLFGLAGPLLVVSAVLGALLSLRVRRSGTPRGGVDLAGSHCGIYRRGSGASLYSALDISSANLFRDSGLAVIRNVQRNHADPGFQLRRGPDCDPLASKGVPYRSAFDHPGGDFCAGDCFCHSHAAVRARLSLSAAAFSGCTILKENIALDSFSSFRGRVLTAVPIKPDGDAWANNSMSPSIGREPWATTKCRSGLWYYRIPTLFEYNQFTSPAFHALIKRALQRPPVIHERNITILTYPNLHVLKLLGVRYVLMPQPDVRSASCARPKIVPASSGG